MAHRLLKIAGHDHLQAVAVEPDQLAQEVDGQHILALGLFLDNDLRQLRG